MFTLEIDIVPFAPGTPFAPDNKVVLISKKAFERVTLCDYYKVDYSQNYKIFRNSTLSQYRNIKSRDKINNTFIRDIIRREGE